jgi:hypothetical protein
MKDRRDNLIYTPELIRKAVECCWTTDECVGCPIGKGDTEEAFGQGCDRYIDFDIYPAVSDATSMKAVDTDQLVREVILDKMDPFYADLFKVKEADNDNNDT